MTDEQRIWQEVEKTLMAFENRPKLGGNPFLSTRVMARLAGERTEGARGMFARIRLAPIVLTIVVLLNIVTAVRILGGSSQTSTREQLVSSLSEEFGAPVDAF